MKISIKYKEYNYVMKAIPTGLMMLMRSYMLSYNICRSEPVLCLCNEEEVSLDPNAALLNNKARSNRQ